MSRFQPLPRRLRVRRVRPYRWLKAVWVIALVSLSSHAQETGVVAFLAVRAAMEQKCAGCHQAEPPPDAGRGVFKASRKWAGITDIAALHELVEGAGAPIADPDATELMALLHDPEEPMPPLRARSGPLSPEQMAAFRAWIAAGAPVLADAEGAAGVTDAEAGGGIPTDTSAGTEPPADPHAHDHSEHSHGGAEPDPAMSASERTAYFVARCHPVVVHFPIAILLLGLLAEILHLTRRRDSYAQTARFCAILGAVAAVVATVLGLMLEEHYDGNLHDLLERHEMLGIATAVLAVFAAGFYVAADPARRDWRFWLARILLLAACLTVGLAGHLGGSLVYGPDYFSW